MSPTASLLLATFGGAIAGFLLRGRPAPPSPRLEAKLDVLMASLGVPFDPAANAPDDVREALAAGDRITAIKRYRAHTGCGLKEAKEAVDLMDLPSS